MASVTAIQSEGDLEVVLLHESHSVLAEIIGPELYSVAGTASEQSVVFHTSRPSPTRESIVSLRGRFQGRAAQLKL